MRTHTSTSWLRLVVLDLLAQRFDYVLQTTPVPVNAHNSGIVIWWVAKQLLRGKDLTEAPADWERETRFAMDLLHVQSSLDAFVNFD